MITITSSNAYIILALGDGKINYIPKSNLTIAYLPTETVENKIVLTWPSGSNRSSFDSIRLGYTMIASPSVSNDADLLVLLQGYADEAAAVSASGGAGGGSIVYTNAAGDFTATPGTGDKTVTLAGLPFTLGYANLIGGSIKKVVAAGGAPESVYSGTESIVIAGNVITLADADDFVGTETLYVTLIGQDKWYDRSLDVAKVVVQNPEAAHYTDVEHIVDSANSTVDQHYSPEIFMAGYRQMIIQFTGSSAGSGVTFKVYSTVNPDAATPADGDATPSLDWVDRSTSILGAATKVLDGGASFIGGPERRYAMAHRFIIQYEPDNATNTADVYIRKFM